MIKGEIRHNQFLELVANYPGLNFRDMMRLTGLKNGVVSYYVRKLEKKNQVNVIRKTGNTRFFPVHIDEQESVLLEMLRRPTLYEIILLLQNNPRGLFLKQIMENVKKAQSTISVCLQLLHSKKIIYIELYEKKKIFTLKNVEGLRYVLQKYDVKPINKTIENFNDMFELL